MKRIDAMISAAMFAVAAAGASWFYLHRDAAVPVDAAETTPQATVLAQTTMVRRGAWPLTLDAFGEVGTARPETLSFPQAGRLSHLEIIAGQRVRRGDALATLESDPNARAAYAQAASAVDFTERELTRNRDLLALQLATQAQVDAAARQRQDAATALAAQAKLGGASAATTLHAPFDAIVVAVAAAQGDRLPAGGAVLQLARADALRVLLIIDPVAGAGLRAGMPVTLAIAGAAPDADANANAAGSTSGASSTGNALRGRIASVQNVVDPKTQMSSAIALLPAGSTLAPGLRVTASIELGQGQAWRVPRATVLNDEKGAYLFQVVQGHGRRVAVRKLGETPTDYGVVGALDATLPVLVSGNYEVQDGGALRTSGK